VANAGSNWLDSQQQCIRVAIDTHLEHPQDVSAALAFLPQTIAQAAEKNGLASSLRLRERIRVHKAEHQDFAGAAILNNRGHQPTAFFKCNFHVLSPKTSNLKTKNPLSLLRQRADEYVFSESLRTTQRARHVAVMMMVTMRPEMIQNAHLLNED
jgi:hypothetical protein